jgi:hypothetical protein
MWSPRNILGMAGLLALMVFAFYFQHVRDKAQKYDGAVAELARERGVHAAWKVQQRKVNEASGQYQTELRQLRADIGSRPAPVIRVCPQPAVITATTAPAAAAGPGTAAAPIGGVPAGAGVPVSEGIDIGPGLKQLLTRSEQLGAQLRAIPALHEGE